MSRIPRLLIWVGLLAFLTVPHLVIAEPVPDEVFPQEVGSKVLTDKPVWAVAVWQDEVYAGLGDGLYRLEGGDRLVRNPNSPSEMVTGLHEIGGYLWMTTDAALWRFDGSAFLKTHSDSVVGVVKYGDAVVAATEEKLYQVEGERLGEWSGLAPGPIQGIAVYAETIYCLGFDRVFLFDGDEFNHEDVVEFGAFPSKDLRAVIAHGNRLLVGTHQGLGVLRGTAATQILASDGIAWEECTSLALGLADDYWIGTVRGAMRAVDDEFHYFAGPRWLPDDHVNAIVCDDDRVVIATNKGLGMIRFVPMTLLAKADYYERHLEAWGQKRGAFVHKLEWNASANTWMREVSDNDVGWSTHYWAANAFKYAVTGDERARRRAVDGFRAMKWSEEISSIDGFPARSIWAVGETGHKAAGGSGGFDAEWHPTEDGLWEWKGDTSSDEIDAHYYYAAIFHDLVADESEKAAVREHVSRVADHIIDNGWVLRDVDGKPTVWGRWDPEYFASAHGRYARGLNGLEALTYVTVTAALTNEHRFWEARDQLLDWGYHDEVIRQKLINPRGINHSDDRLAFYCYHALLQHEADPKLRSIYRRSLERSWEIERIEGNPWYNFIYGGLTGNDCEPEVAVKHLREWPLDLVHYPFNHEHRKDDATPDGYLPYAGVQRRYSPRESGPERWVVSTGRTRGGGGHAMIDPSGWLDAYWMGRYYGFIDPPSDDVEIETVSAEPPPGTNIIQYDGPEFPRVLSEN